jgi:hypothetical protein
VEKENRENLLGVRREMAVGRGAISGIHRWIGVAISGFIFSGVSVGKLNHFSFV